MLKRISSFLLVTICISNSLVPNKLAASQANNYDSGKKRILTIMSHPETGVTAYNKQHIHYAETRNLAHDLNITEMARSFGCKTVAGQSFIEQTLQLPVNSQDIDSVLADRQNAIRTLVSNPQLKQEIEQLITRAQQHEQEVIKLFSDFFIGKTCPELQQLELIKKQNPGFYPFVEFLHVNPTGKQVITGLNIVGLAGALVAIKYNGQATYRFAQAGINYGRQAFMTAYFGLLAGINSYSLYKDYANGLHKRLKLHALNQLIMIAEKLDALCVKYAIKNQFKISNITDPSGVQLIKNLKHARYQKKNTLLFQVPCVHTFLYQVYQQEKQLAQLFACIAEMDTYNAVATKIIESKDTKNKFCFVTFAKNDTPLIRARNYWSVLVKNAVTNSISEDKKIMLSGPNAGGKTTNTTALLQNITSGQSLGIAAAEEFEITAFDTIHSYLHISDDLMNGLSLFAAEVKRAQEIIQKIKSLQGNQKFFFALDELFTGTVAEDGETCAYEFVKNIASYKQAQFIYATHFNKLKELGSNNPFCTNYKVDAPTKNQDGTLVYPFTLNPGASDSRVALDIARNAQLFI